MKKGTKIMIGVGALVVAGVVFYFVNQKYGWIALGGSKASDEATASACGCGHK